MSDDSDRLSELREELDRDQQRQQRAQAAIGPVEARDEGGSIAVSLDADGAIAKVTVREAWRGEHGEEGLAGAIMAVYADAASKRMEAWGHGLEDEAPGPVRAPEPGNAEAMLKLVEERGASVPATQALEALDAMLDEMLEGIDAAFDIATARGKAEHEGKSSSGAVRAVVVGAGGLASVAFRSGWLKNRHSFNISREVNEAIQSATKAARAATPADPLAGTPLERLSSQAADPEAIAARLRLIG
ncbi:MAG: hypothetical protein LBT54_04115 [Bifidobacteriaceae bacterium]|jgi:DNA-binding protein YbaB|nr:hypothetical protein [Bifidobacteriaceae bacterium]